MTDANDAFVTIIGLLAAMVVLGAGAMLVIRGVIVGPWPLAALGVAVAVAAIYAYCWVVVR